MNIPSFTQSIIDSAEASGKALGVRVYIEHDPAIDAMLIRVFGPRFESTSNLSNYDLVSDMTLEATIRKGHEQIADEMVKWLEKYAPVTVDRMILNRLHLKQNIVS